jgi:flagellar biosynthetic protein FliP
VSDLGPSSAIQLAVVLTLITLAPAVILTCTTFARFAIVFSFLKMGLGTQGAPPNQVLAGLSLFMTMFVMAPVTENLHTHALAPYLAKQLDEAQALEAATPHLRSFLLANATEGDLALFYEVSDQPRPETEADVPLKIAIPAFVL